jgi:hypothetical protein
MLAIEAGGIAALIVGVVAVARSSAFTSLRKITEAITPLTAHGEGSGHRREHPDRHKHPERFGRGPGNPRTHRREDLNGLRPDPVDAAGPRDEPAPLDTGPLDTGPLDTGPLDTGPLDVGRPRRVHRRPLHGPASGEEGG